MGPVKIILSSNRGSYTVDSIIRSEFESLTAESCSDYFLGNGLLNLNDLNRFINNNKGKYILGYIGYEVGLGLVEKMNSQNARLNDLPNTWFMAIEKPVICNNEHPNIEQELGPTVPIEIKQLVQQDAYYKKLELIKQHIQLGDIYEINYCIPFVAENIEIEPEIIYKRLQKISPMPFGAFIDHPEFSIISASPERFIKKQDNRVFIQPMKGTKPRGKDVAEDLEFYNTLGEDKKERSENVMIVDLTRNDLSKIAQKGTVKVDELFGVYSFKSVHQMISTVSCDLKPEINFCDILKATFPMGSMTGAPKKRAMQLIEAYEDFARGPFSGMLGCIDPRGNFDFNVMIRTIFYSKKQKKLFVAVGSAITAGSDVEKEYEECLIKLQPLLQALNATIV